MQFKYFKKYGFIKKASFCTLFVIYGALISCSIGSSESEKDIKVGIIEEVDRTKSELNKFSDFLGTNFDFSFLAQYRPKPDDYFFFYWKGNTINGSFVPIDSLRKVFRQFANLWRVDEVLKYEQENFFRIGLVRKGNKVAQILVLKNNEVTFKFSSNSRLSSVPTISSLNNVKYYGNSFILKLTNSVMIYFL